jgi:hypothetical protein
MCARIDAYPHCGEFIHESAGSQQEKLGWFLRGFVAYSNFSGSWHSSSLAVNNYLLQPSGNMQTILSILNFPVEFPYA